MRKIALAMASGGFGKTTIAVILAHGLALAGKRVLLVDRDTQAQIPSFILPRLIWTAEQPTGC